MHRHAVCLTLLTLFLATGAAAQTVEIVGTRDRARQLDTAAMTVVGREELLRYGDQTVADALKRMPGITVGGLPGRGGEIRMRGLGNGYTQVLLNGQPVPAGFLIDTISPELIERIEIMRVASAELGSQAIAGTINIVLRKSAPRAPREFKLGAAGTDGRLAPDATGQAGDNGAAWSYTVGAALVAGRMLTAYTDDELGRDGAGAVRLMRRTRRRELDIRPSINLTPRINWTLPNGDTLSAQNFVRFMTLDLRTNSDDVTAIGAPTEFPANRTLFKAHAETLRSDVQWIHQADGGGRWDVKIGRNHFQRRGANDFEGIAAGADRALVPLVPLVRRVDSSANEDNVTFGGKFAHTLAGGHTLLAGWDAASGRRTETRREQLQPGDTVAPSAYESSAARLDRMALFAQDDWSVTALLSVSAGLRWETLRTATEGNVLDTVRQQTTVLSPLVQAVYKLAEGHQLRAGLTRTFKMPTLTNLALRRYTVDNDNSAIAPDMQGNPHLLPERAWGLDAAYERYFGKDAMASASAYLRRIDDVTIERVEQVGSRWISTPVNAGRAATWGVEFEAKWPLPVPRLELRANLARNWSRVAAIAGPDNRLASQVPLSAGVGIDHRMTALPVTLGASVNFVRGGALRLSERGRASSGAQRDVGMVAVWRVDARSQWRMSVANLLGQDHLSQASFGDQSGSLQTLTATPTAPTLRLAFEHKMAN
ncbi:MAG: TonB-dependent receptor [Pseudomonadota bacterium]|nr:TonB-dependent receptor [Pseudomonadota bacterium]